MKSYTWYLITAYGSVAGCLCLLGWMSLRQAIFVRKQILNNSLDLPQ